MSIKNVSVTSTQFLFGSLLYRFELSSGQSHCGSKTASFTFEIGTVDLGPIDITCAILKTKHSTKHNAFRDSQPLTPKFFLNSDRLSLTDFRLVEIASKQIAHRVERSDFINTIRNDAQIGTAAGCQHQDTKNGLSVRFNRIVETMESDGALELIGDPDQIGCSTSVKTETTSYAKGTL
jgi:hypothetical protein